MIHFNKEGYKLSPSKWVVRFANEIEPNGTILDLACGSGRHTNFFLQRGHHVTATDIDTSRLQYNNDEYKLKLVQSDLEKFPWPFSQSTFSAIIVTNYLYRPIFPKIVSSLKPNGLLIYETFAEGNEAFGHPKNPAYLLKPGELLSGSFSTLKILAYEDLVITNPKMAAVQRLCAKNVS